MVSYVTLQVYFECTKILMVMTQWISLSVIHITFDMFDYLHSLGDGLIYLYGWCSPISFLFYLNYFKLFFLWLLTLRNKSFYLLKTFLILLMENRKLALIWNHCSINQVYQTWLTWFGSRGLSNMIILCCYYWLCIHASSIDYYILIYGSST